MEVARLGRECTDRILALDAGDTDVDKYLVGCGTRRHTLREAHALEVGLRLEIVSDYQTPSTSVCIQNRSIDAGGGG